MKILALDSSDGAWSVALRIGTACVQHADPEVKDSLGGMDAAVGRLLDEAGISMRALDRIACTRGPGGFTGVRVAVGLAQGLALGAELPVAPISSLAALAHSAACGANWSGDVVAAMDARMDEIYCAAFRIEPGEGLGTLGDERLCRPQDLEAAPGSLAAGRGFGAHPGLEAQIRAQACAPEARPDAAAAAALASQLPEQALVAAEALEPVYLRTQVARKRA